MTKFCFGFSNPNWVNNAEDRRFFIAMTISYLMEKLTYREYLYLNEIYEQFGVKWNPDYENICYRDLEKFFIDYELNDKGEYIITIN